MTMQTARNPFAGVPPTQLLRTFQQIAKDYTRKISGLYDIPFENVTFAYLETLEKLTGDLTALSQVLLDVGNRLNPFATLEYDSGKRLPINWISFTDYQQTYDFYLTNALPNFPHKDFYGWLCHDIIQQTYRLNSISGLLMVDAKLKKSSHNTHSEMTNQAHKLLWHIKAIVDAVTEYERQQFGEG